MPSDLYVPTFSASIASSLLTQPYFAPTYCVLGKCALFLQEVALSQMWQCDLFSMLRQSVKEDTYNVAVPHIPTRRFKNRRLSLRYVSRESKSPLGMVRFARDNPR